MITDDEAYYKWLCIDGGGIREEIGKLVRWAYEKGRQDEVNSFTSDNGYIKPKFKVGDNVLVSNGTIKRTIVDIKLTYKLDGEVTLGVWREHDLVEYKDEPLKVGDNTEFGKIVAIFKDEAWIDQGHAGCSTYYLKDLERV